MSLNQHLDSIRADLLLCETEETWNHIADGIDTLTDICRNGAGDSPQELILALKSLSRPLISALNSERTRLSGPAIELITAAANGLGPDFEPLLSIFLPTLLLLCSRTNKVVITRARACVLDIVQATQLPSILPHLLQHSKDKTSSLRLVIAECTLACLNCFNPPDLEKESRARDIESLIRVTAKDAAADVRRVGRDIYKAYTLLLPTRVKSFVAPLSPTTKKYLDVKLSNQPGSGVKSKSHLAASTSSVSTRPARHMDFMVPERPKSSLSCHTNDYKGVKRVDSDVRPHSALQNCSAPLVVQNRHEARRVPVLTAERMPVQVMLSSAQPARPRLVMTQERVGDPHIRPTAAPTGPKRIPLPEALPTLQPVSRANDMFHTTLSHVNPAATSVQRSLNNDSKDVDKKKIAGRLPNSSNTSGNMTNDSRRSTQRSVSQPTQSQLAKTKPAASKLAVSRQPSHKSTVPKSTKRKVTSHQLSKKVQAEPKTAAPTPSTAEENSEVPIAIQPKETAVTPSGRAEEGLLTGQDLECETPKKAHNPAKDLLVNETPISALLTSIEQGFLSTASSPISPPQMYVNRGNIIDNQPFPLRLPQKDIVRAKEPELPTTELKDEGQRQVLGVVEVNSG